MAFQGAFHQGAEADVVTELPSPHGKQQPAWGRSREVEISTHLVGGGQAKKPTFVDLEEEGMNENGEQELEYTNHKLNVEFTPSRGELIVRSASKFVNRIFQ